MTVYLINLAFIFIWSIPLININTNDKKKKLYCAICAVQWALVSGLRDWSVGADTMNYYSWFEMIKTKSWSSTITNVWDYLFNGLEIKDPGYNLLQKIFQIFSNDYQMWLVFIGFLFTGLMARWIYKYSSMPEISFLLYSALFYSFFAVTGHRQTIATALIYFVGYEYAKNRKFVKFAIVAFVAFLIHKSSLVFIVFYIVANIRISMFYSIAMFIVIAAFAVFGKQLYGPIAEFLGFSDEQIEYDVGGAETYATVLLLLCIVAFCLYPWISKRRIDAKNIYNMLFLTMGSTVLLYHNQSFMRVQQYFSLGIMVVVPEIILTVEKKYRVWPYLAVVIVLVAYLIRNNPQYEFFFT